MKENIRVRFAPSPTGPLHIGGVRTALYNYLLAKQKNGSFILRIEDTDQKRYIPGAEKYILEALEWLGVNPDEGPGIGGEFGPYRQSERKSIYQEYAKQLVESGKAYYAFDSAEDLGEMRLRFQEQGIHSPKYDQHTRMSMKNSLTLSEDELANYMENSEDKVIRLKVPANETVEFKDMIRGNVAFKTDELDDKVLLKADGMPTYHLANIIDDKLMEISHVIRGEEWLSSTAHHVLLYRAFGWENEMPVFAHLPLILKPNGKGKLSKRDGAKFGFPVFPLAWEPTNEEEVFHGFREDGFNPDAVINFLAMLGWNPGTEQEIFSLEELVSAFSLEKIVKSGARFDIEKAKWYNQQYILHQDDESLFKTVYPLLPKGIDERFAQSYVRLFKDRVHLYTEFPAIGKYFFEDLNSYEEKMIRKKWKNENLEHFDSILNQIKELDNYAADILQNMIKSYIQDHELKFGDFFPILRLAITGTMSGPDLFATMELMGKDVVIQRLEKAFELFPKIKDS